MLLPKRALDGIPDGSVTLAFRRWQRPTVKPGGRLRTVAGELAIDAVEVIDEDEITDEDARRAGEPDAATVLRRMRAEGTLYRIRFHLAGPDPRVALRRRTRISPRQRAELDAKLARMPGAAAALQLIAERPETLAAELAAQLGREKLPFKADVRKLKELGLTESLSPGYRLSPRGRAYLRGR